MQVMLLIYAGLFVQLHEAIEYNVGCGLLTNIFE